MEKSSSLPSKNDTPGGGECENETTCRVTEQERSLSQDEQSEEAPLER